MDGHDRHDVRSRAAIGGHPIHPMLIPFPIAFLVGALVTDLAFWGTHNAFWAQASFWLVAAGVVMGLAAALPGLVDLMSIPRAYNLHIAWIHGGGNVVAVLLSLVSLYLRWGDPAAAVLPWGLVLSIAVGAILSVTGWLGGEMAYRHAIGFSGAIADADDLASRTALSGTDLSGADRRDWRGPGGRSAA